MPGGELFKGPVEKTGANTQGWLWLGWLEHIAYHVLYGVYLVPKIQTQFLHMRTLYC